MRVILVLNGARVVFVFFFCFFVFFFFFFFFVVVSLPSSKPHSTH